MKYLVLIGLFMVNLFASTFPYTQKTYSLEDFMDKELCDKVLNKGVYSICYDNKVKGPLYVTYKVHKATVDLKNIKPRPKFYTEKNLSNKVRTRYSHYTYTGFDRGHMAPDASFDYSQKSLNKVYSMANIVPQYPKVNQKSWLSIEDIERIAAKRYGVVEVVNVIKYDNPTNYLKKMPLEIALMKYEQRQKSRGKTVTVKMRKKFISKYRNGEKQLRKMKIVVPSGFYKVLTAESNKGTWQKCFYVKNEIKPNLNKIPMSLQVDCKDVRY